MTPTHRKLLAASAILIGCAMSLAAKAADATGEWLVQDGDARVRISPCGAEICGNISWIREGQPLDDKNPDPAKRTRPLLGSAVLLGLKPAGTGEWAGSLYNADDGRTYTGKLTVIDERHIKVSGCVLGGLICQGQTWTRVK